MVGESIKQSYVERNQMFITSKIDEWHGQVSY